MTTPQKPANTPPVPPSLPAYQQAIAFQVSRNEGAQNHFTEGLMWCYGFHQELALSYFEAALTEDPNCPMALWGVAYCIGPFYNRPWIWFCPTQKISVAARAFEVLQVAMEEAEKRNEPATHTELIQALQLRYQHPTPATDEFHQVELRTHANAMLKIHQSHPSHADIAALTAEALMNLNPWKLWDLQTGEPCADARTLEAIAIIESGLANAAAQNVTHAGLLHFHVHALEMSPNPENALHSANQLRNIPTPCGHLPHMATHIDIQLGEFAQSVETNARAVDLDNKIPRARHEFYLINRLHNSHMKLFSAMMCGRLKDANEAQQDICALVCHDEICQEDKYLGISIEGFFANQQHVRIRFGQWQAIVDEPAPKDTDNYLLTSALHYYATSIAYAALRDHEAADAEAERFQRARQRIPDWHIVNNNPTQDILDIAEDMQCGERLYHRGRYESAFAALRNAVQRADRLVYCEPWPWMHPPRHALGALLLAQGHVDEAADVFETDLGTNGKLIRSLTHPNNVWALHGLHECYQRQGNETKLPAIEKQLQTALAVADVPINSSCCCSQTELSS